MGPPANPWVNRPSIPTQGSQVSRAIRRFRGLGLLKKIAGTFKYYITKLGQRVIATAMRLREADYPNHVCAGSRVTIPDIVYDKS